MPFFKFRIYWEEDDNIYRDIIIQKGQTFLQFKDAILTAFEFTKDEPSSFFESNDKWSYGREISSGTLVNKKDAPSLSMLKTPVSALIEKPDQKFLFIYDPEKRWTFQIILIGIEKDGSSKFSYPYMSRAEGLAPAQTKLKGLANERLLEVEEKYDLNKEDMEQQGFGDEGSDEEDENDPSLDDDSDDL